MSEFINTIDVQGDPETLGALVSNSQTTFNDNVIQSLGNNAFRARTALTSVDLPSIELIGSNSFNGCVGLTDIDLKNNLPVTIAANGLYGVSKLEALVIRSNTLSTLNHTNGLEDTRIRWEHGWIFVPNNLVSTYKAATNWSTYRNQIWSIDKYPVANGDYSTIDDSWEDIFESESDGTYLSKYSIGGNKMFDYNGEKVIAKIVAFDSDVLSDNSGHAKITWIVPEPLMSRAMGNGNNFSGWGNASLRSYIQSTILNNFPSDIQNEIKAVDKTYYCQDVSATRTLSDTLWVPSCREIKATMTGGQIKEDSGVEYDYFSTNRSRMFASIGTNTARRWWTRTTYTGNNSGFITTYADGSVGAGGFNSDASNWVVVGFCT